MHQINKEILASFAKPTSEKLQQDAEVVTIDEIELTDIRLSTQINNSAMQLLGTDEARVDWLRLSTLAHREAILRATFARQTEFTDFSQYATEILEINSVTQLSNQEVVFIADATQRLNDFLAQYSAHPNYVHLQITTESVLGQNLLDAQGNLKDFTTAITFYNQVHRHQLNNPNINHDEATVAIARSLGMNADTGRAIIHYLHDYVEQVAQNPAMVTAQNALTAVGELHTLFPDNYGEGYVGFVFLPKETIDMLLEKFPSVFYDWGSIESVYVLDQEYYVLQGPLLERSSDAVDVLLGPEEVQEVLHDIGTGNNEVLPPETLIYGIPALLFIALITAIARQLGRLRTS